jgi:hypothetical protein
MKTDPISYLLFAVGFFLISNSEADDRDGIEYQGLIGFSLERFNYEEEDDKGSVLDREDGNLPKLSLELKAEADSAFLAGRFRYSAGEVKYKAHPGTSGELKSHTTERIHDFGLFGGYQQQLSTNLQLEYAAGFGYREWDRNIHSLSSTSGLAERYRWPYMSLGVKPIYEIDSSNSISMQLDYRRVFNASLDVEFKRELYDPVSIDLKNGQGVWLSFTWKHRTGQSTELALIPYYEHWRFDKSKETPLKRGGVVVGSVHEPENQTNNFGMELALIKTF